DLIHTYGQDYKLIFVGDASMSPYEIILKGGSVEHMNPEPGEVWLRRLLAQFKHAVWLNPMPQEAWEYTQSIGMVGELMQNRMYPLTLEGLEQAMRQLKRSS
ncbi:MAG: VWA domain-containing protein, partial [Vogesella sp.]|nr:VWA domain-containing protein [Vogesella sp.]